MASRTAYSTWTPQKPTLFNGHYLRNRSTLDIGVLGYIGTVQHSPEVLSIHPGTPCILPNKCSLLEFKNCNYNIATNKILSGHCKVKSKFNVMRHYTYLALLQGYCTYICQVPLRSCGRKLKGFLNLPMSNSTKHPFPLGFF